MLLGVGISFLGIATQILLQVVLARTLGIEDYASFAYWRTTVLLAGGIACLGLNAATVKVGARYIALGEAEAARGYFLRTMLLTISCALGFGVATVVWLGYAEVPVHVGWIATCFGVLGFTLLTMASAQLRALGFGRLGVALERLLPYGIVLVVVVILALFGLDLDHADAAHAFVGILLVCAVLGALLAALTVRSQGGRTTISPAVEAYRSEEIRQGARFFAIALAGLLGSSIPLIAAGFVLETVKVGIFALLISVCGLMNVPLMALNMVVGPELSAAHASVDVRAVRATTNKLQALCITWAVLAAAALILARPWIEIAFDVPGSLEPTVYATFIGAPVVALVLGSPAIVLQMCGFEARLAAIQLTVVLCKIILGLWLGNLYELLGFAVAELISAVVIGTLVQFHFRRRLLPALERDAKETKHG